MKILVTGGCGYKGSVLIPKLLQDGHQIVSIDNQWFGNSLPNHPNLENIKLDIRDIENIPLDNVKLLFTLQILLMTQL